MVRKLSESSPALNAGLRQGVQHNKASQLQRKQEMKKWKEKKNMRKSLSLTEVLARFMSRSQVAFNFKRTKITQVSYIPM